MTKVATITLALILLLVAAVVIFVSSKKLEITTPEPTSADLQRALIEYNPNFADYHYQIVIRGVSGNFVTFAVEPEAGAELDPAQGFAQFVDGSWQIINLGTGGDPTDFYRKYDIPKELRIPGY